MKVLLATVFRETFSKVYGESSEKIYIFKIAYGMIMLGEAVSESVGRIIGTGIAPDTFIGVRFCKENCFYLRETDSEFMYECKTENLLEYSDKDWAKDIFRLIGHICLGKNINGAQVLLHKECGTDFAAYDTAVCYAFSNILNLLPDEWVRVINNINFAKSAKNLISLSSCVKGFWLVENQNPVYILHELPETKIVLAFCGKQKEFIAEDESFIKNEEIRIIDGVAALKRGDLCEFGKKVKESAKEYFDNISKNAENLKIMFDISKSYSDVCGIYEKRGIFTFVKDGKVDEFIEKVEEEYKKKSGEKPEFYICAQSTTEQC